VPSSSEGLEPGSTGQHPHEGESLGKNALKPGCPSRSEIRVLGSAEVRGPGHGLITCSTHIVPPCPTGPFYPLRKQAREASEPQVCIH
jgi:hypothetical protein